MLKSSSKENTIKFVLFIILVFIFLYAGKIFHFDEDLFTSYLTTYPVYASWFIYIFLYVVVTFFIWLGPKDLFRIIAAVLYGAYLSTILIFVAEMCNVAVLFSLSRKLGREYVQSKLRGRMHQVDEAIAGTSFWRIFFLRFFPVIPLRFLDLGFGLTRISLKKYFVISSLSSPLRIFIIQYMLVIGADTYRDPQLFVENLAENPVILWILSSYTIGSLIVVYILKRHSKKVHF